jgi:hypothetical protein
MFLSLTIRHPRKRLTKYTLTLYLLAPRRGPNLGAERDCYGFLAIPLAGWLLRSYPPEESITATIAMPLLCCLTYGVGGLLLSEQWSIVAENIRIGTGHLSYRVDRLPWLQHRISFLVLCVAVFWSAFIVRVRNPCPAPAPLIWIAPRPRPPEVDTLIADAGERPRRGPPSPACAAPPRESPSSCHRDSREGDAPRNTGPSCRGSPPGSATASLPR